MDRTMKNLHFPLMSVVTRQEQQLVTIKVGSEHQKYYLHHAFLCHHSGYFKGALNGPWKESQENTIDLDDIKSSVFNVFVYWLYSQQLPSVDDWPEIGEISRRSYEAKFEMMVQAIIFADRFLVPKFRVAVCNALVDFVFDNAPSSFDSIIYAFANLPAEHMILRLLVDVHCYAWNEEYCSKNDEENFSKLPVEFIKGVFKTYTGDDFCERKEFDIPLERCHYHEHEADMKRFECEKKREAPHPGHIELDQ